MSDSTTHGAATNDIDSWELEEILHEALGDAGLGTSGCAPTTCRCWGGSLMGDASRCDTLDAATLPSAHFKYKLCAACQVHGITVPEERVRVISPSQHDAFINTPSSGVWTERAQPEGGHLCFRTVNQTAKCVGSRLVVFQSPPPLTIAFPPLPRDLVRDGVVRLRLCKGTLVPDGLRATARPRGGPSAMVADRVAPKRPREARSEVNQAEGAGTPSLSPTSHSASLSPSNAASPPPLPAAVSVPSLAPALWSVPALASVAPMLPSPTAPLSPRMRALIGAHTKLSTLIATALQTLHGEEGAQPRATHDPTDGWSTHTVAIEAMGADGGEGGGVEGGGAVASTLALSDGQRTALDGVQDSLHRSLARLRPGRPSSSPIGGGSYGTYGTSSQALGGSEGSEGFGVLSDELAPPNWLPLSWWSNPPSAPGSGGSTRSTRIVRGRWSSGLWACLSDPQSCVCTLCCWPILFGQLGQKIVRTRHLCSCFALTMLIALAMLTFFFRKTILATDDIHAVQSVHATPDLLPPGTARHMIYESLRGDGSAQLNYLLSYDAGEPTMAADAASEMLPLLERFQQANGTLNGTVVLSVHELMGYRVRRIEDEKRRRLASRLFDNVVWLCGLMTGGVCVWITLLRALVRTRDGIPGSALRDCGVTMCCFFCGVCQLARHEGFVHGRYGMCSPTGEKVAVRGEALAV